MLSVPPQAQILTTLKSVGTRLVLSEDVVQKVRQLIRFHPLAQQWFKHLRTKAEAILSRPLPRYELQDGVRLVYVSQRVIGDLQTLAFVHRIEPDSRILEQAVKVIDTVTRFADWNPIHFLDTTEMATGVALATDWLHDEIDAVQREAIVDALISHVLVPARDALDGKALWSDALMKDNNWNPITAKGLILASLLAAERHPELAGRILHASLSRLPHALRRIAPDGAWYEGPYYWLPTFHSIALMISALESALGDDLGLSGTPGLSTAGDFPIYMSGAHRLAFDIGDAHFSRLFDPCLFFLSHRYDRLAYATYQRHTPDPMPLDLIWFDHRGRNDDAAALPLDRHFRGAEYGCFRSSWTDPDALIVVFKAGNLYANHTHLDRGTFSLDALGERWIFDPGREDYNVPGYWDYGRDGQRWTYYRCRAEGHNTLVINPSQGPDQEPQIPTSITEFQSLPDVASARIDLTSAYADASSVEREFRLVDRSRLTITDHVQLSKPGDIWWFAHTSTAATIQFNSKRNGVTLSMGSKRLTIKMVQPQDGSFFIMPAHPLPSSPNPAQNSPNPTLRKMAVHLQNTEEATICVEIRAFQHD